MAEHGYDIGTCSWDNKRRQYRGLHYVNCAVKSSYVCQSYHKSKNIAHFTALSRVQCIRLTLPEERATVCRPTVISHCHYCRVWICTRTKWCQLLTRSIITSGRKLQTGWTVQIRQKRDNNKHITVYLEDDYTRSFMMTAHNASIAYYFVWVMYFFDYGDNNSQITGTMFMELSSSSSSSSWQSHWEFTRFAWLMNGCIGLYFRT